MAVEHPIKCNAILSYSPSRDPESEDWVILPHFDGSESTHNVTVNLDGRLNLIQKTKLGSYRITYDPSQYKVIDFFAVQKEDEKAKKRKEEIKSESNEPVHADEHINYNRLSWKLRLDIMGGPTLNIFETFTDWKLEDGSPEDCPLALKYRMFARLDIEIERPHEGDTKVENWHEARVLKLLYGKPWDSRFQWPDSLDAERAAVHAERIDALLQFSRVIPDACHVRTSVVRGSNILLKIYPQNSLSHKEWPTVLHPGSIINVSSGNRFNEETGMEMRSRPDGTWTARVNYELGNAPICALLCEELPGNYRLDYYRNGFETDFAFSPTRLDVTSIRGLDALETLRDSGSEDDVMKSLDPDSLASSIDSIPVKKLLLENEEAPVTNDEIPLTSENLDLSDDLISVSDEKREAIMNIFSHSVSVITGPPGSGKTLALMLAAEALLKHGNVEKILICSATNNVVDEITRTLAQRSNGFKVAKVISHGAADDEYYAGVHNDVHGTSLHTQCMEEIENSLDDFPDYANGLEELRRDGRIHDNRIFKRFRASRDDIMKRVLKNTQIAICTLASSHLPVLTDFRAEALLIDDTPRAKTYEILMPIVRFGRSLRRLVLTGDPKELNSYFTTANGRKQWGVSIIEKLLARKKLGQNWPIVSLKEVHRSHKGLFEPVKTFFYQDQATECLTGMPDAFMRAFDRALPLTLPVKVPGHQNRDLTLTKFMHFIDVPEPETKKNKLGSCSSVPESEVIIELVQSLLRVGVCTLTDILVEVFYTKQIEKLRSCAVKHRLISNEKDKSLAISTVHAAQGLEANVVILGLTKGGDKNLNWSMMNTQQVVNVAFSRAKNVFIIVGDWEGTVCEPCSRPFWCDDDFIDIAEEAEERSNKLRPMLKHLCNKNEGFLIGGESKSVIRRRRDSKYYASKCASNSSSDTD